MKGGSYFAQLVYFTTRDVSKRNMGFIDLRRTEVERESKLLNSFINGNNPRTESKRIRREKSLDYKG